MRAGEFVLVAVLVFLGIRSLVHWMRRPFDSPDPVDHALFAAFVVGRVGSWLSMAGFFYLSATFSMQGPDGTYFVVRGRAFSEGFQARYWWYPLVFIAFFVLQFLAGYFLGRREGAGSGSAAP